MVRRWNELKLTRGKEEPRLLVLPAHPPSPSLPLDCLLAMPERSPYNLFVLGAGRSGTSLVAGILAKADYFMGEKLVPARAANPKGFFEDPHVNELNDELLAPFLPPRTSAADSRTPTRKHAWLAQIDVATDIRPVPALAQAMQRYTAKQPYCLKDPRFCYTLPAWHPHLAPGTRFVCVFRHPSATAQSVLKDLKAAPNYYGSFSPTYADLVAVWTAMYRHILEKHRATGAWLFLHFEQVLGGSGLEPLARFTHAPLDRTFADVRLRRSRPDGDVPPETAAVYAELCALSGYASQSVEERFGNAHGASGLCRT